MRNGERIKNLSKDLTLMTELMWALRDERNIFVIENDNLKDAIEEFMKYHGLGVCMPVKKGSK